MEFSSCGAIVEEIKILAIAGHSEILKSQQLQDCGRIALSSVPS